MKKKKQNIRKTNVEKQTIKNRKVKKENKNKRLIFFLFFLFVFLIFILIFIHFNKPFDVSEFEISFLVGEDIGVVVNTTKLDYGMLSPGMASTKKINIENNFDFDVVVKVLISRDLREYVFGDEKIIVPAGQILEYPIRLSVPVDSEYGSYSGKIKFEIYKKAKFL